MKNFISNNKIAIITLILILGLSILKIAQEEKIYATGDAVEYTIMTEAFYNHFSPDVRSGDFDSFKKAYKKKNNWGENNKAQIYDDARKFIKAPNHKKFDYSFAFFADGKGKNYSCHFFVYSLFNLPVRLMCKIIGFNPLLVAQITNILLILISCFFFFKYSIFKKIETAVFIVLFFYSTNYWYLAWQHTEVFTVCFATAGFWLFIYGKKYIGVFLVSIAALQNQPVAIIVGALVLITLFSNKFTIKNIVKLGCASFLVLVPSVFYYFHFGVTNLIKFQGVMSFDYVTFTRVFGFFFDINQGVILALPFILFLYLYFIIKKIILIKTEANKWELFIPLALIIAVSVAAMLDNWNHGQAVVNRYVTYIGAIILVHTFYMIMQVSNLRTKKILLIISIVTQIITIYYHQSLSKFDWSTDNPKPISKWVLNHFPGLYNPDPVIFISRYFEKNTITEPAISPAYYMNPTGEITKLLVHDKYLNNLEKFGLSKTQIDSLRPNLKYINHWAYITVDKQFRKSLSADIIKIRDNERKLKTQIEKIKNTPDWYKKVQDQAQKEGISEEDALQKNAAFILGIKLTATKTSETKEIKETKDEKIKRKIIEIKNTAFWLAIVEEKAKKQHISLDSAIYIDAKWVIEEEMKK